MDGEWNVESLTKLWPLMYSIIQEFWNITEPAIEETAIQNDIPLELYLYSEFGLENVSIRKFQKRDPFTNPEQFEKLFARLNIKGLIEPMGDGSFRVTETAREAARHLIQAGDAQLPNFHSLSTAALERLTILLKQIIGESKVSPEPPEKWAILKRFHVADENSPLIAQLREQLMDLYAYRDDSHLSAARPHFNEAGIVWLVVDSLWKGKAVNAEQIAEKMAFRGYEVEDYEIAIQAAIEVGWVQPADPRGTFCLTPPGKELREQVEHLTNQYFYAPWSVLMPNELNQLYSLLTKLRDELDLYKRNK